MSLNEPAFDHLPVTPRHHFVLHFYTAVYRIIHFMRRLGMLNETNDEEMLAEYPFLSSYFAEMLTHMPGEIGWDEAFDWWEGQILLWEESSPTHLPLRCLAEQSGLTFRQRLALIVLGLVEEDSRFGTLFARLQEPLLQRRPCLELVGQILADVGLAGEQDPWTVCRPLLSASLAEVTNPEMPRAEWVLRVPAMLWDVVRGENEPRPTSWCHYASPDAFAAIEALIIPPAFRERLTQVPQLIESGKTTAVILRGIPGSDRLQTMGAVAKTLGRGAVIVPETAALNEQQWRHLGAFCAATQAIPILRADLGPGETIEIPTLLGYQGPLGILLGFAGGLRGEVVETAVSLNMPMLQAADRRLYWQQSCNDYPLTDLDAISQQFHLPGAYIRQAAKMAIVQAGLEQSESITLNHVQQSCRALNRQLLDTLADRLEVDGSWNRLVVSEVVAGKLHELERRCRYREQVLSHLGQAFGTNMNRGVRALFTGASGTGKTLAAKILAAELGMDLYRVDLAAVINKYIGETEKNLHQVLSRAEALDVIVLLDEGDALLSNRTEVKSANDRYANLETNYLLQKLEHYQGIVLVTSNAAGNIDRAFQRRMDVVVNFVAPQAEERWHIWRLHLPSAHAVTTPYLEEIAVRCVLTGGQIRNAALHATLLALDDGKGQVQDWHLEQAVQSEYRKASMTSPLGGNGRSRPQTQDTVEAFIAALS